MPSEQGLRAQRRPNSISRHGFSRAVPSIVPKNGRVTDRGLGPWKCLGPAVDPSRKGVNQGFRSTPAHSDGIRRLAGGSTI